MAILTEALLTVGDIGRVIMMAVARGIHTTEHTGSGQVEQEEGGASRDKVKNSEAYAQSIGIGPELVQILTSFPRNLP